MSAKQPAAAKPSQAELDLQTSQKQLLDQQRAMIDESNRQQNLIAPFLYKQAGIQPLYADQNDPTKITGYQEVPGTGVSEDQKQIEQLLNQRTLAALKGELPVDSGLLNELDTQQKQLEQRLEKQLGTGYATSSPGIEALANFQKNKSAMLDAARRGDLTLGEQLGIAQQQSNSAQIGDILSRGVGIQNQGLNTIGAMFNLNQGYASAMNTMQQNRIINLNAPQNPSIVGGILQGAMSGAQAGSAAGPWGAAIGAVAGGAMGGANSSLNQRK